MTEAQRLANWIRANQTGLTHLKLQKLAFYCYGIGAAFGHGAELGTIPFVAWKHGPVCVELYDEYKSFGTAELSTLPFSARYSDALEKTLNDVLRVYGNLSAWQLRNQSHLEEPWQAWDGQSSNWAINGETIVRHFQRKFTGSAVEAPEYVSGAWSLALDKIPARKFRSFEELANSLS